MFKKTGDKTYRMLKEHLMNALCQAKTVEWFQQFKKSRESIENDRHSSQPHNTGNDHENVRCDSRCL